MSDKNIMLTYYAYVRFVEKTPLQNKTFTVDQSQIIQKFNADLNFKRNGKYSIKHSDGKTYKAQIIFLERKYIFIAHIHTHSHTATDTRLNRHLHTHIFIYIMFIYLHI